MKHLIICLILSAMVGCRGKDTVPVQQPTETAHQPTEQAAKKTPDCVHLNWIKTTWVDEPAWRTVDSAGAYEFLIIEDSNPEDFLVMHYGALFGSGSGYATLGAAKTAAECRNGMDGDEDLRFDKSHRSTM